jgi:starch synthase
MKILMVAAEFAPYAKTGGLADATAGLAFALQACGHDTRILIPRYAGFVHLPAKPLARRRLLRSARLFEVQIPDSGMTAYLSDTPRLKEVEDIYAGDDRDALRFISLSDAVADVISITGWMPDIVHCHDWHAALVAALLSSRRGADRFDDIPTVLTLHNIGYQGVFAPTVFAKYGYPEISSANDPDPPKDHCNFLRTGILTADAITTVSPTYAREIQTAEQGMGLEDAVSSRSNALTGILNGVDYSIWDPRSDPFLGTHYGEAGSEAKHAVKSNLCARLDLPADRRAPLVGVVSRLAEQKGIDVLVDALPAVLSGTHLAFAILGTGDAHIEAALREIAQQHPDRIAFKNGYDEELAHWIIAGSDLFVVPSRYEPCGLTQLYALRYGTVPVVRQTGGLADTVQHFEPETGTGNGCVFRDISAVALQRALRTAAGWYANAKIWHSLTANAMRADHSWLARVPDYEAVYESLLDVTNRP